MGRVVSLAGAAFALLCLAMVLFALPAAAQDDGGIPPGTAANGVDTDDNNSPPDVIEVAASDCSVSPGASITLEDYDGTQAVFTDGDRGITISDQKESPRIEGPPGDFIGDHARFPGSEDAFETDGNYTVVSSTGITGCRGGNGSTSAPEDQYSGDVNDADDVVPGSTSNERIPSTGGPPLLVFGVLLLCAAVVVGRGVLRQ